MKLIVLIDNGKASYFLISNEEYDRLSTFTEFFGNIKMPKTSGVVKLGDRQLLCRDIDLLNAEDAVALLEQLTND